MTPPRSVEELLTQMVACDTVNAHYAGRESGEAALAAQLEEMAVAWGLGTRRFVVNGAEGTFNLFVYHEVAPDAEWLLCESHLDTVGVAGMTIPPFTAAIREGRIHGRGTCDTKGSGAAMLWALRSAAQSGKLPRNTGVLFSIDEEAHMTGASVFARTAIPRWPGKLRGMIVGEPTRLLPFVAHNGVVRWKTVTRGVAAHSAEPSRGRSAISAMLKVVEALESEYVKTATRTHPLTGSAAASVNMIRGGTQVNIIPARCEIEVDRRLVPGETAESALADRDLVLAAVQSADAKIEIEHLAPPYVVPPLPPENNLALHAWLAPVLAAQGVDPKPRGARYVTNASHYGAAGVPVIVLGPGDISQAHRADEWLEIEQLRKAVEVYLAMMTLP